MADFRSNPELRQPDSFVTAYINGVFKGSLLIDANAILCSFAEVVKNIFIVHLAKHSGARRPATSSYRSAFAHFTDYIKDVYDLSFANKNNKT